MLSAHKANSRNENFVGKAPAAVIEKEQQKLADANQQLSKLQEQKKND